MYVYVLLSGSLALWATRGGPTVAPEALLASREALGVQVVPGEIPIGGPLRIHRTLDPEWGGWFAGSCPGVFRAWNEGHMNPEVIQYVARCSSPLTALARSWVLQPERRSYPNFELANPGENNYPHEWHYRGKRFAHDAVVCGVGGANDGCQAWFYTARYRQYYVEVRYFGPNQPISSEEFAGLVGLLMGETEATLKSRE